MHDLYFEYFQSTFAEYFLHHAFLIVSSSFLTSESVHEGDIMSKSRLLSQLWCNVQKMKVVLQIMSSSFFFVFFLPAPLSPINGVSARQPGLQGGGLSRKSTSPQPAVWGEAILTENHPEHLMTGKQDLCVLQTCREQCGEAGWGLRVHDEIWHITAYTSQVLK